MSEINDKMYERLKNLEDVFLMIFLMNQYYINMV